MMITFLLISCVVFVTKETVANFMSYITLWNYDEVCCIPFLCGDYVVGFIIFI
jgi:hypothetical protein